MYRYLSKANKLQNSLQRGKKPILLLTTEIIKKKKLLGHVLLGDL